MTTFIHIHVSMAFSVVLDLTEAAFCQKHSEYRAKCMLTVIHIRQLLSCKSFSVLPMIMLPKFSSISNTEIFSVHVDVNIVLWLPVVKKKSFSRLEPN